MHGIHRVSLIAALCGLPLHAQSTKAEVFGAIADPSGLAVQGAHVSLRNTGTKIETTTITGNAGEFQFFAVSGGDYSITVSKTRFATLRREGIGVRVGDRMRLDLILQLGDTSQSVEVTAAAPLLETSRGTVSFHVEQKRVVSLPAARRAELHSSDRALRGRQSASGEPAAAHLNAFAGFGIQRPNRLADPTLPANQRSVGRWFDTTAFSQAPQFTIGNSSRNPVVGPPYRTVDLMLGKTFAITERVRTESARRRSMRSTLRRWGIRTAASGRRPSARLRRRSIRACSNLR